MIRKAIQRLGIGYLLMLPSLICLGSALDFYAYYYDQILDPPVHDMLGHGLFDHSGLFHRILSVRVGNLCIMLITWNVGAFLLLHPKEAVSDHRYWRIIFGVCSAAFIPVFLFLLFVASMMNLMLPLGSRAEEDTHIEHILEVFLLITLAACAQAIFKLRASRSQ